MLDSYLDIKDGWLKGDRERPKNQRHRARRTYTRLCSEYGHEGSERTVREYVHKAKLKLEIANRDGKTIHVRQVRDPEPFQWRYLMHMSYRPSLCNGL